MFLYVFMVLQPFQIQVRVYMCLTPRKYWPDTYCSAFCFLHILEIISYDIELPHFLNAAMNIITHVSLHMDMSKPVGFFLKE